MRVRERASKGERKLAETPNLRDPTSIETLGLGPSYIAQVEQEPPEIWTSNGTQCTTRGTRPKRLWGPKQPKPQSLVGGQTTPMRLRHVGALEAFEPWLWVQGPFSEPSCLQTRANPSSMLYFGFQDGMWRFAWQRPSPLQLFRLFMFRT